MSNKALFLIISYLSLGVIASCVKDCEFTSYDFSAIDLTYQNGTEIGANESLIVRINEGEIEYYSNMEGGLFSISCATERCDVYQLYPIVSMQVYSNADWDNDYLAGSDISELVAYGRSGLDIGVLSEVEDFGGRLEQHVLTFPAPSSSNSHVFTIRLEKSNGNVVEATTETITWE